MESKVLKGNFIKKYRKKMISIIEKINPEWTDYQIESVVDELIKERLQNPEVDLTNSYTGEDRKSTLLSVLDYELDKKPVIAGDFTFYLNQDDALNPNGKMLQEKLAERKSVKKKMWKVMDDKATYDDLDRLQKVIKVLVNGYYGASGSPTSPFYFVEGGPSITGVCQELISTAEQMFEGIAADNYIFINLSECMEFCETALKEDVKVDEWITHKTASDLFDRLSDKIICKEINDEEILKLYFSHLSQDQITRLYYKNNIFDLIQFNKEIQDRLEKIMKDVINLDYVDSDDENWVKSIPKEYREDFKNKSVKDYNEFVNKMYFMDPNNPPKNIKSTLGELSDLVLKYTYTDYLSFDRIYRLKNFKRRVVTVIDTDSNFLSLDTIVGFLKEGIFRGKTYNRSEQNNNFIIINTLAYILTAAVTKILYNFCVKANVPEDYRHTLSMKNELFISKLLIGEAKKRYIAKTLLREGNLLTTPKVSATGFDFKKSTTSEYAEKFFNNLIEKHIMNDGDINIHEVLRQLDKFREDIINSIKNKETKFLPNGAVKEIEAYRFPEREQSVRGSIAWNCIYPNNQIEFPSKVSLLKLNIFKEEDAKGLEKTNPEIYRSIINNIFNDTTGIFNTYKTEDDTVRIVSPKLKEWWKNIPKKYRAKYKKLGVEAWNEFAESYEGESSSHEESKIRGMQVLAIPSTEKIPDWVDPYIDYSTIVNDILSPFMPVLRLFSIKTIEEGQLIKGVNRKTEGYSNIIKL